MPNRLIPWQTVAHTFGGKATVETGLRSSSFSLLAQIGDFHLEVSALNKPYSLFRDWTTIELHSFKPYQSWLRVSREQSALSLLRRIWSRDVQIGERSFDDLWFIRARYDAYAQAVLGPTVTAAIQSVPTMSIAPDHAHGPIYVNYGFETRGNLCTAYSRGFEQSDERLASAIRACLAIANHEKTLESQWRTLTSRLDGRFEYSKCWRMDGTTRIIISILGKRLIVMPVVCKFKKHRRLRTRITAERTSSFPVHLQMIAKSQVVPLPAKRGLTEAFVDSGDEKVGKFLSDYQFFISNNQKVTTYIPTPAAEAIRRANPTIVELHRNQLTIDFDGNMLDPERILAAASAAAIILKHEDSPVSPYR